MERCQLVREVGGYRHTLSIDVHNYEGWKVRVSGYDGQSPEPNIFELIRGGRTEASCEPVARKVIAKYRAAGWADELSAKAKAAIDARVAAESGAATAKQRGYQARVAKFPVSALDQQLARAIAKPTGVRSLELRGTRGDRLTVVPPTIARLKALEVLRLDGNELVELPAELEQLTSLRELHLAHNRLTELPRMVWHLEKLRVLDLHGNRFTEIFKHFGFPQQKGVELQLGGNPLGRGTIVGTWPKLGTVGIDTAALFPIDRAYLREEYPQKTFPLAALHLYGRAPTTRELAEVKKLFPKAAVRHLASAKDGPLVGATPVATKPTKPVKRGKPGPLHREQAAHERDLVSRHPELAAAIKKLRRPCLELFVRKPSKKDLAPGATRIGGVPDLPPGAAWPTGGSGPMVFVAQLDLAAIAAYDPLHLLPSSGLLSFFAGNYDEGVVLHTEDTSTLTPMPVPKRVMFGGSKERPYPACGATLRGGVSLPFHRDARDEASGWFDLVSSYRRRGGKQAEHQVLGHHRGDTQSLDDKDLVLLALGSDHAAGMTWGDAGVLYFAIDPKSLARRAWDEVQVTSTD